MRGLASGTRSGSVTSPLASGSWVTRVAVAATRRSGRSDSRTNPVPSNPVSTSAAENTATSAMPTSRSVESIGCSGSPVMFVVPSWPGLAISWYWPRLEKETVTGPSELRTAFTAARSAASSLHGPLATAGFCTAESAIQALNVAGPVCFPHRAAPPGTLSLS